MRFARNILSEGGIMEVSQFAGKLIPAFVALIPIAVIATSCTSGNVSQGRVESSNGAALKTFTQSLPRVSAATLLALDRMGIEVESRDTTEKEEVIKGKASDMQIEIQLEAVTPKGTRMKAIAKKGLLSRDEATATEIVLQTEKFFNRGRSIWG